MRRSRALRQPGHGEHGVTMILVALAMIAIIAMAALSIDVITLYLAREEAQRSADQAALAAARVISLSGMTGDPANATLNWAAICAPGGLATQAAQSVAQQNAVAASAATTVNVTYSAGNGGSVTSSPDCSTLASSTAFGVNPMVTVQLTRPSLPTFFSRIWGSAGSSVTATAAAEAFNPSASDLNTNGGPTGAVTPVQPRSVKPFVVPNLDPLNPLNPRNCTNNCRPFVSNSDGSIQNPGISLNGTGATGVIGETFWLVLDCQHNNPAFCQLRGAGVQPEANYISGAMSVKPPPNLLYIPGQVGTPVTAVPSCWQGDPYEEAIEGSDAPTNYQCGVKNQNAVDLSRNPGRSGATTNGVQCLIQQSDPTNTTSSSGQDYFGTAGAQSFGAPGAYPFQILAGTNSPLGSKDGLAGVSVSSSPSIVSLPIYDNSVPVVSNRTTDVTFVGFLQVFINAVDQYGNVNVTVLNVAGCGNGDNSTNNPITGSSPVPVRLITPP
jgi:Flp pilus assembly protein TadG